MNSVAYYKAPIQNTMDYTERAIESIVQEVRTSSSLRDICEKIRSSKNKMERNAIKGAELPFITPHAVCSPTRMNENVQRHTGLLLFDVDHRQDVEELKSKLTEDEYVAFAFVSPSGEGLKFGSFSDADISSHDQRWGAAAEYFMIKHDIKIDTAPRALASACYLSYDPKAFYNPMAIKLNGRNLVESIGLTRLMPSSLPIQAINEDLTHLHPVDKGNYFKLDCPKCGRPSAFMYKGKSWIYCSHKESCGHFEFLSGTNEPWFDKRHNFNPAILAEFFLENFFFVYYNQQLYFWDGRVYRDGAEAFIKSTCQSILKDSYKDSRGVEVFRQIETNRIMKSPTLDEDKRWIILENGALDWKTGELHPHSPEILASTFIPLTYDPEATCPNIDQFFRDVMMPDCLEIVYELFGYCLTVSMIAKKCFLLHGGADGGKSKFIDLLIRFVGNENAEAISLQDLTENRFRAAGLVGKLVNAFPDLNNSPIRLTGLFKALVSGDCVQVERKGQDPFKFRNKAKFIFSANEIPRSDDKTDSYYVRWVILKFPNSFPTGDPKRDENILDKLTTPTELSGLLNKALAGLRVLMEAGDFSIPQSAKAEMGQFRADNENVHQFIASECTLHSEYWITKTELHNAYESWCQTKGIKPFKSWKFNSEIVKVSELIYEGRHRIGLTNVRTWEGLNLRSRGEENQDEA